MMPMAPSLIIICTPRVGVRVGADGRAQDVVFVHRLLGEDGVQALLPAHHPHLRLDVDTPVPCPSPLRGIDVFLPPVVCHEQRQLIDITQLRNAFAAARMHHKCLRLLCRMPDVLVVRRWHEERSGGG